jgi:hypothetical protein
MIFVAFNMRQILAPPRDELPSCGLRMVEAKSLDDAKAFMRKFYPGHWAIIPKKVYDQGVVNPQLPVFTASKLLEVLDTDRPLH